MFRMIVDTRNAAFEGQAGAEVARLLREAAADVEAGYAGAPLRDLNGNTVGRWSLEHYEKPDGV